MPPASLMSDAELTVLALEGDPDRSVPVDAVSIWDLAEVEDGALLPEWYMPAPRPGGRRLEGWRRRVALLIIISLVMINAYGLCSTYGEVVLA